MKWISRVVDETAEHVLFSNKKCHSKSPSLQSIRLSTTTNTIKVCLTPPPSRKDTKIFCTRVFCHTNRVSGQSRTWTVSTLSLLKNGFKPGSSLSRAKAGNCTTGCNSLDNLSLFLCCFSNPTYLKH